MRPNPDERLRELERAWRESGDPYLLEQLVNALQRAGEHRGSDAYLAFLRARWADLAARKRALRLSVLAYRKGLPTHIPRWQRVQRMTEEQRDAHEEISRESGPLGRELALELGRHGKLWASLVSGYYQTSMVRLHDEKDSPKGSAHTDWIFLEFTSGPGVRGDSVALDLASMRQGSPLRSILEGLRAEYGARSRALELREAEEDLEHRTWRTGNEWASHARAVAREGRAKKIVGWNPHEDTPER
jgi:hypothetical protein